MLRRVIALCTLFGSLGTAGAQQSFPPLPDLKFAEIRSQANYVGDRWSYMEAGPTDGPVIVMLHGVGGNSMDWRFQLDELADRFHVVAWNAPGYMLSDGLKNASPGCRDYADALADFLDALRFSRVGLVGNSFGTRVSQCFAIHYAERVSKLALLGVGIGPSGLSEEEKTRARSARAEQVASGGYGFGARADALVGPNTSPELMEVVRNAVRATNPRGYLQGFELVLADGYSPEEVAAKVIAPVMLISGSEDRVNPIATTAAKLHEAMPQSRLEIIEGVGHLPHLEAPKQVNRLLADFFAE
jgi:pimeloyl-ACP methyl ester carboxylesterase